MGKKININLGSLNMAGIFSAMGVGGGKSDTNKKTHTKSDKMVTKSKKSKGQDKAGGAETKEEEKKKVVKRP